MSRSIKILTLTLLLFFSLPSWGACENMSISVYPSQVNLNTGHFQKLDVEINKGEGTCVDYYMTLDNGNASSSLTRSIQALSNFFPVQFYRDSSSTQIFKSELEASASDVISGSISGSTGLSRSSFFIEMKNNENTLIPFGNYSQNFKLKLFEGTFGSALLRDQKNINVTYFQSRIAELSLVTTGSSFTKSSLSQSLDFGQLAEGATRSFDVVMLHNAGFAVSVSSLNGGKLKHESKNSFVDYSFMVDGAPVGISSAPTVIRSGSGVSSTYGTRLPVLVKIGDVSKARAGTYSDIVTISVASTE